MYVLSTSELRLIIIRDGLRLLQEELDWRAHVRRRVAEGLAQADGGETISGEEAARLLRRDLEERRVAIEGGGDADIA